MPNSSIFLSKSKYLSGLKCHKLFWYYFNAKDEIPEIDAGTQAIFDQGHLVGEYAKKLFPGGIEVAKGIVEHHSVVEETYAILREMGVVLSPRESVSTESKDHEALGTQNLKPLFEAAFLYKNAFARVDVLEPIERGYNRSPLTQKRTVHF